ncbi:MAG: hypothetical protein M3Z75_31295, partial [Actinomycetota bacterium]|nr:hypothetical protein [Actinomycetota bacterium]
MAAGLVRNPEEDWMAGLTSSEDSAPGPGDRLAAVTVPRGLAREEKIAPDLVTRVLAWSAVVAIGVAILVMVGVSAAGPSAAVAAMPRPAAGPPW